MDSWDMTYGVYTLEEDEGTFNDDFHTFGFYWDDKEMVRQKRGRDTQRDWYVQGETRE